MEVEAKFIISSEKDFKKILNIVEALGFDVRRFDEKRFYDYYLVSGNDKEAIRYRFYSDGRIIRTYKKDVGINEGVVKRIEEEKASDEREFRRERDKRGIMFQTFTSRKEYDFGNFKLSFDSVYFNESINMLFVEIEGYEKDVKLISDKLKEAGFISTVKSKLRIGLDLLGKNFT